MRKKLFGRRFERRKLRKASKDLLRHLTWFDWTVRQLDGLASRIETVSVERETTMDAVSFRLRPREPGQPFFRGGISSNSSLPRLRASRHGSQTLVCRGVRSQDASTTAILVTLAEESARGSSLSSVFL
ncbi:hypothetical protein L596_001720 [Steinernema carpocapsae]|uniref:Uncharacterized protein n=1 Tax=Steinernema carpocapsae TaxID=34508 RepID=A0A4U8UP42_STECR|nr:hypothetical protein L596_001720 [Steinernema carpocapsae]